MPSWVQRLLEDPKQQPDDTQSQENEISSDQSDSEPDSDSEDLVPAIDDTSATETESGGAVRNHQSSHYPLRARIDPPETSIVSARDELNWGGGDVI